MNQITETKFAKGDTIVLIKHGARFGYSPTFAEAVVSKVTPTGIVRAKGSQHDFTMWVNRYGSWKVDAKASWGKDDRWGLSSAETREKHKLQVENQKTKNDIAAELRKIADKLINGYDTVAVFAELQAQLYRLTAGAN